MDSFTLVLLVIIVIVILAFGAVFTIFILDSLKKDKFLISKGFKDEEIKLEEEKRNKTSSKVGRMAVSFVGWVILIAVVGFCAVSVYTQQVANGFPTGNSVTVLAIATGSMSEVNDGNSYFTYQTDDLGEYVVDESGNRIKNTKEEKEALMVNEFSTYSLITLRALPEESELKVGDVIAYKNRKDQIIVHRLVQIKPGYDKPYVLQGDDNAGSDGSFAYKDLGAIYVGEHIPGLGAFVMYMQSPVGIIVVITCLYIVILVDIVGHKVLVAEKARLKELEERRKILYDEDGNPVEIRGLEQEGVYV